MKNIHIVGTSHIARESIKNIEQAMQVFQPNIIAVELDKRRYQSLMSKKQEGNTRPGLLYIRRIGVTGYLFLLIGGYLQKKLGHIVGIEPGSDMKRAIQLAKKNKLPLALIDRDIEITLKRFSKKFTFKEKMKILKDIITAPFSKQKIKFDLRKVPKQEVIKTLMAELRKRYPNIFSVLIDERNKFMARQLFQISRLEPDKKILCVIGAGHEEGLKEELKKLYYSNVSFNVD